MYICWIENLKLVQNQHITTSKSIWELFSETSVTGGSKSRAFQANILKAGDLSGGTENDGTVDRSGVHGEKI